MHIRTNLAITLLCSHIAIDTAVSCTPDKIRLESTVITQFDGIYPVFDGTNIGNIIFVITGARKIMYGILDPVTKKRVGKYLVNQTPQSLMNLAMRERHGEKVDFDVTCILNDLYESVKPFFVIALAEIARTPISQLLDEWACKAGRINSPLIPWYQEVYYGNEYQIFKKYFSSIGEAHIFCQDLIHFLETVVSSCPKGLEQAKQLAQKR